MRLGIFTTGAVAVLAAVSPGTYAAKEADTEKVEKERKDASRDMNRALGESAMSAYIHDAADGSGLQEFEGKLVVRHIQDPDQHHEPQLCLMFPNGIPANIINLPPADQIGLLSGGETIMVKGQFTEDGSTIDAMGNVPEVLVEEHDHITGPENDRTILMVLVSADDSVLTSSVTSPTVSTAVFGSGLSVSSQISACSYGNLTLSPAQGHDFPADTAADAGITTVNLNQNITGEDITTTGFGSGVEGAITTALNDNYGVSSPAQLADHVMYCVPPGTGGWVAYAYTSFYSTTTPLPFPPVTPFGWLSVYNDIACLVSGDINVRDNFLCQYMCACVR